MSTEDPIDAARRWRCFGRLEPAPVPCHAPATFKAPNPGLHDRICYFCAACRPEGALPITRNDLYQVVYISVLLTVPATTLDPCVAGRDAQSRVLEALDALGATIEFQRAWGEIWSQGIGLVARAGADQAVAGRQVVES